MKGHKGRRNVLHALAIGISKLRSIIAFGNVEIFGDLGLKLFE